MGVGMTRLVALAGAMGSGKSALLKRLAPWLPRGTAIADFDALRRKALWEGQGLALRGALAEAFGLDAGAGDFRSRLSASAFESAQALQKMNALLAPHLARMCMGLARESGAGLCVAETADPLGMEPHLVWDGIWVCVAQAGELARRAENSDLPAGQAQARIALTLDLAKAALAHPKAAGVEAPQLGSAEEESFLRGLAAEMAGLAGKVVGGRR